MSEETKWVRNPKYDALGPENEVYVDPRFTRKGTAPEPLPKEWEEFGEIPIGFPQQGKSPFKIWRAVTGFEFERIFSWAAWRLNRRNSFTDTIPTNVTEGAD